MSSGIEDETAAQAVVHYGAQQRTMNVKEQLALSSFWFATNLHWGALLLLIIPIQCKGIMPSDSAGAIAKVFGYGSLIAMIVPLIAGALSDRSRSKYGRRRPYMVVGIAINLVGLAIMGYAAAQRSLLLYVLGYCVVQFGNNSAGAAYAGIIPDMVPVAQHGEASGYMAMMTQAGTIVGALGSGILLGSGHAFLAYSIIAAILVAFVVLTVITVREVPMIEEREPLTVQEFLRSLVEPLQYTDFRWVLITRALVTLGMWCVQPYIANYLSDVVGVKNAADMAGKLFALILLTATFTGYIGGKISDAIGRKKVVYIANTLIAVCSIAFVFSHSLAYTFIVGAIYGIGYGAYFSVDWALACDTLPNVENAGKDMGIWHVSMVLPQTLAPFIAGNVFDHVGQSTLIEGTRHYAVMSYQVAFTLAAVFLMMGAFFLRNVRDRKEREAMAAA